MWSRSRTPELLPGRSRGKPRPAALALVAILLACGRPDAEGPPIGLEEIPLPRDFAQVDPPIRTQFESARASLADALENDHPRLASSYGELGELYHAYGHCDIALQCYRQAAALEPDEARWVYLQGVCLREEARLEESNALLQEMLVREPGYQPARIRLGMNQLSLGRRDEARRTFERIVAGDADNVRALLELARLELEDRRPDRALELLQRAEALQPDASGIHYTMALAYRASGDVERAERHASRVPRTRLGRQAIEVHDPYAARIAARRRGGRIHVERALEARLAGRPGLSVVELRQALAADPDRHYARLDLAELLYALGRLEEAEAELEVLLRGQPGHVQGRLLMARLSETRGEVEASELAIREVLSDDPGLREGHLQLGRTLIRQGRWDEALAPLMRAKELDPAWDLPRAEIARCLLLQGSTDAAWESVSRDLNERPDSPLLEAVAARILLAAGRDADEARRLATVSVRRSPLLVGLETMAMVMERLGDTAGAAEWQQVAVRVASDSQRPHCARLAQLRLEELRSGGRIDSLMSPTELLDRTVLAGAEVTLPGGSGVDGGS